MRGAPRFLQNLFKRHYVSGRWGKIRLNIGAPVDIPNEAAMVSKLTNEVPGIESAGFRWRVASGDAFEMFLKFKGS